MGLLADPHRSRVVLVGAGAYDHLPELPAVPENLIGLARVLRDPSRWGITDHGCRVVGEPHSPPDVHSVLEEAASATHQDGLFLVYYAGHGIIDSHTGALHLAVASTRAADAYATAVPYEWVRRVMLASPAAQRVVILDCCYAGRAIGGMGDGRALADEAAIDRACVLVAASANRIALAPPEEPYSAFTGALLDLFDRGVPGGPDPLDLATCYEEIVRAHRARSRPTPELRARNGGERIGLVRNLAARSSTIEPTGQVYRAEASADPELAGATIGILAHSPSAGTLGVRLDRLSSRSPADLLGDILAQALGAPPVIDGGPLRDALLMLVVLRDGATAPKQFQPVSGPVGTMPPDSDVELLEAVVEHAYLYLGYLGWAPGQLESDLRQGTLTAGEHGLAEWLVRYGGAA